jgi:hypothetical protein
LLVSVKSSGIGEHLNADMRVAALHISQHASGDLVHAT